MNTLADSLLNLDSYNILKRNEDIHDDGPTITIRINKGNISKTVRFIDYLDSNNKIYLNFYHYFESLSKEKSFATFSKAISSVAGFNFAPVLRNPK